MPFGLQGAPATFQQMMNRLIDGCDVFAAAYLDDSIIHSTTWEKHLQHIKSILVCFRAAGLTAKPTKCQFGMRECAHGYLDHVVGNGNSVSTSQIPKPKSRYKHFSASPVIIENLSLTICFRSCGLDGPDKKVSPKSSDVDHGM